MVFRGDDEVGEAALDFSVSARARARGNGADVGGWSRGVAPRGERSVESRGSPGVAAREDGAARVTGGDGDAGARAFT